MKTIKTLLASNILSLAFTSAAFAEKVSDKLTASSYTPFSDLGKLVGNVFTVVIILASILLFLYLILGGIQWLTSGGDKMATQAARDRITAALTGLLIILAIWGVFRILELAFGISVLGGINVPVTSQNPDLFKVP